MKIHPTVKEAASIFAGAGKQVYLVGGAVRDLLRGEKIKDWDLATDARPEEVMALFQRGEKTGVRSFVVPTGIKHGTVTIHFKELSMETTTFRSESGYSDARHPDKVEFGVSIETDLSRRDFTMNAAAYKLPDGPLIDPFDGGGDIKRRLIRAVGKPEERFSEDGLRPIRALRFASQLDFSVDEELLAAIPGAISFTAKVAAERIRDELEKILKTNRPSSALILMERCGLLKLLLPALAACRGVEQSKDGSSGYHRFDVLDHSLLACDFAAREGFPPEVRLAALFHDIGKPASAKRDDNGDWTFYRHEKVSSALTRELMGQFRYPNAVIDKVCLLIDCHMFNYTDNWSDAAVRRFIIKVGEGNLDDLYALRMADAYALAGNVPPKTYLLPMSMRIDEILAQGKALSLRDLAVSGRDLMEIGIKQGKTLGIILDELLEAVLDDPELNSKEKLLEIASNINRRY